MRILYTGQPGAEQNQVIIDRYGLTTHMFPLERFWPDGGKESYDNSNDVYILVDSCSPDDGRLGPAAGKIKPIIVIDHHCGMAPDQTDDNFIWIERVGACATMMVSILDKGGYLDFSKEKGDDMFLPVLLALGIRVDTNDLVDNMTQEDWSAYSRMYELANKTDLKALIRIPKSKARVAAEDYARNHRKANGLRLVSCAGHIGKNYVFVAEIANEMIDWQGVSVAVVFGLTHDRKIVLSIRSTDITLHSSLSQILHDEFGNGQGVKRSEDGSRLEGGGQINIGFDLSRNWENQEAYLQVIMKQMEMIFLNDTHR
jgi:nanoRNase/pAp phosphatase (c-di-AMP/oligoRNAs hydrolase)